MNFPKNRLWLLVAFTASLTGCGGGGGGGGDTGSSGSTPTPVTNTAPTVSTEAIVVASSDTSILLSATGDDADGDTLTYNWTQTRGTAVTNAQGFDTASPSFTPAAGGVSRVETLAFSVEVSDGRATASTSMDVLVARDATRAAFVDGTNGNDISGDGTISQPYATIAAAIDANGVTDIYIKALPDGSFYDERNTRVSLEAGRSMYGGFDDDWVRDLVALKSVVVTNTFGIRFTTIDQPAEISGMDVRATAPVASDLSLAVPVLPVRAFTADGGTAGLRVVHNRFVSEDPADETVSNANFGGSSLTLKVLNLPSVEISNNVVISGNGAPGKDGEIDDRFRSGTPAAGGDGGAGGTARNENGDRGGNGGSQSTGSSCGNGGAGGSGNDSDNGSNGVTGCHGTNGAHGIGGRGYGGFLNTARGAGFVPAPSTRGADGQHGGGGGGGGGGEAGSLGGNGGRGGDGGRGGRGAGGTLPATAGGASIGVEIHNVAEALIWNNEVTAGQGGLGGRESTYNTGADGDFGFGGNAGEGVLDRGGNGGNGGQGGDGGDGGYGGSGAGGPSYAIHIGDGTTPTIRDNTLQASDGGLRALRTTRIQVPAPSWYADDGWSAGIFMWTDTVVLSGIGDNAITIGEAGRTGLAANIANRNGEVTLP